MAKHEDTPVWNIADRLHDALCKHGHQMDQCWGLRLPYDQNREELSPIQALYLEKAERLIKLCEGNDDLIDGFLNIIKGYLR